MSVPGDSRGGRPAGRRITLDIVREDGDWASFEPVESVIEAAAAALAALPDIAPLNGQACIVLASDAHVRTLNATWRGKDQPTNVLSFPAAQSAASRMGDIQQFLGDIVLAAETLGREAAADAIPAHHHLQHLVIHGLLHLIGYDHESDADAEIMEALEVAALAALGVPSPYDDGAPATDA